MQRSRLWAGNNADSETVKIVYEQFKGWFIESVGPKVESKRDFSIHLQKAGLKVEGALIKGVRSKHEDGENSD